MRGIEIRVFNQQNAQRFAPTGIVDMQCSQAFVSEVMRETVGAQGVRPPVSLNGAPRRLRHKPEAEYHLIQFHGSSDLLERLERPLRITDAVLRHRVIKLKPGTPDPPDLRKAAPSGTTIAEPAEA